MVHLPLMHLIHPYGKQQRRRNRDSRDSWQRYAEHRERVTQILCGPAENRSRLLSVWGAGNGNDLDLRRLLQAFSAIHLYDLDHEALQFAVDQQSLQETPSIVLHGGVDLMGAADILVSPAEVSRDPVDPDPLLRRLRAARLSPPCPRSDVVASVCLLSQLIEASATWLGGHHPRLMEVITEVRRQHLRLMFQTTRPGGRTVLITEILSSDTLPDLAALPGVTLQRDLIQQVNAQNFYTGLNPAVLESIAHRDPELGRLCDGFIAHEPWRWDFGPRAYAVAAFETRTIGHG